MSKRKLFPFLALSACALWAQTAAPDGNARQAALPKRAQLVTLNVVAFDSHGQPVGDLTEDDFQIQDQGKKQQIVFFRRNETKPRADAPADAHEHSNRSGATVQQATIILLDLLNADLSDRGSGWDGIAKALEHLESADSLYFYFLTAEAKLYPVHGLPGTESGNKSDPNWTKQIRASIDKGLREVNRLKPQDDRDPMIRVNQTYKALGTLATQLAGIPGRKNIVWVTHGVPIVLRSITNEIIDTTSQMRQFCAYLNQAGIAMYSVDQGGPGSLSSGGREGPGYQSQDTLQQMADLTGGHAYPGNNVETAIPAAISSARGSYLIRYDPPAQNWDSKFHKIKVSCTRKGVRIQAQQGYFALPRDAEDRQLTAAFQVAAINPLDASGIGLRAEVAEDPKNAHAFRYDLHIDARDLMLSHQGDHDTGQLAVGIFAITNGKVDDSNPVLFNVNLTREQYEAALKGGVPFAMDKVVPEAAQNVRIVVMDLSTAETGALTIPVAQ
jgi:VWFA-related protein